VLRGPTASPRWVAQRFQDAPEIAIGRGPSGHRRADRSFLLQRLATVHDDAVTAHSAGSGRRGAAPDDEQLIALLQQVAEGTVPVYRAQVPVRYLRPFSPTFKPESAGLAVAGVQSPPVLTYQVGDFFVTSADYAGYYAHLESNNEAVPCLVLGEPQGTHATDVRPATGLEVQQFLGIRPPAAKAAPVVPPPDPTPPQVNIF